MWSASTGSQRSWKTWWIMTDPMTRDTLKHGFPDERTRDRRDHYEPALDVIEKIITLTAGWLYNGPHYRAFHPDIAAALGIKAVDDE